MGKPQNKKKFGVIKRKNKGGIVLYNTVKKLAKSINDEDGQNSLVDTVVSVVVDENNEVIQCDVSRGNLEELKKSPEVDASKNQEKKQESATINRPLNYECLKESFNEKGCSRRRICSPISLIMQVLSIERHNRSQECSFVDCRLIKEVKHGLISKLIFQCSKCQRKDLALNLCDLVDMTNLENEDLDLNYSAVLGAITIGCGFSQLEEFLSILDVSPMGPVLYSRLHDEVGEDFKSCAAESMRDAVEKEKEIAIENEEVDSDGFPNLSVMADGVCCHRSYGTNYKALSGAAAIVGKYTKKGLWYDVRNKYCSVCCKHDPKNGAVKEHPCNISHIGSSSSMEAAILVDGFCSSEQLYGVRYTTLIADGDSSVHSQLIDAKPYKEHIEKIECKNHLHRNDRKILGQISTNTQFPLEHRKLLKANLMRFSRAINGSVSYWRKSGLSKVEKIRELKQDIQNVAYHIFGDHENCRSHFCDKEEKTDNNYVPAMKLSSIFQAILNHMNTMSFHSTSLIENLDQNICEQFNSIVAKFVGGKRNNYSLKQSYTNRVAGSVVQHNTKSVFSQVYKRKCLRNPTSYARKIELKRLSKRNITNKYREKKHPKIKDVGGTGDEVKRKPLNKSFNQPSLYGPNRVTQDLNEEEFETQKKVKMEDMIETQRNRSQIESDTRDQYSSKLWQKTRANMITASKFGIICKARIYPKIVKNILYPRVLSSRSLIAKSKIHEEGAIKQLQKQQNITFEPCGLFIDSEFCFLASTPAGTIDNDGCVEIKCCLKAKDLNVLEAIKSNLVTCVQYDKKNDKIIGLKKNHDFHYQIQGHLSITGRKYCTFSIWTSSSQDMYVEIVQYDPQFCSKMRHKLVSFFNSCLLPEIVDPRQRRGMAIRTHDKNFRV